MNFWEAIKDKWLTWRTGSCKSEREYREWKLHNIVQNAQDVTNFFQGYKHIIAVDYRKVMTKFEPMFGYLESEEFLSYMYPSRPLGQNCFYGMFRGGQDQRNSRFYFDDFGCTQMFVATNSEEDAIMIALKWS